MRREILPVLIAVFAVTAAAAAPVLASQHDMTGMQGTPMGATMAYDKATEKTITGIIDNVMAVPGATAMSGTHIVVKTKAGVVHVHVGPSSYLASKKIVFKKGEQVEVVGSLVKGEGFEAILARRIKRGSQTCTLRRDDGTALWPMAIAGR